MSMEWYQEIALENIYEEIVDELLKTDLTEIVTGKHVCSCFNIPH